MEDFRSKSCGDGRMQMESYHGGGNGGGGGGGGAGGGGGGPPISTGPHDFRCYSTSYASSSIQPQPQQTQMELSKDVKFKKGKSTNGSSSKSWSFSDPELQRKKRVASYKVYAVEGKVKGSFRKSFRWLRDRYTQVLYGWR